MKCTLVRFRIEMQIKLQIALLVNEIRRTMAKNKHNKRRLTFFVASHCSSDVLRR